LLIHEAGYRPAVCDLRGHGESRGTFGFNLHEHHDVAAIIDDLVRRDPVDRVVLLGLSYGGAIAISTAARHDLPISALILVSAVAGFDMLAPRLNPFTIHRHIAWKLAFKRPRFAWRWRRTPKLRAVDDVGNVRVPICLIHVKNDWLVGHRHSVALYEHANEPKELHVMDIEGNYHADRLLSVARTEVEEIVTSFLRRHSPQSHRVVTEITE
jgi:pimeloyl-ACP methyl ester carboxylesterase